MKVWLEKNPEAETLDSTLVIERGDTSITLKRTTTYSPNHEWKIRSAYEEVSGYFVMSSGSIPAGNTYKKNTLKGPDYKMVPKLPAPAPLSTKEKAVFKKVVDEAYEAQIKEIKKAHYDWLLEAPVVYVNGDVVIDSDESFDHPS